MKCFIVHVSSKDLFILVHAFNKKSFKQILEQQLEFLTRIGDGRLPKAHICHSRFDNLVEEELVGIVEIRTEAFINNINQPGKWNLLVSGNFGSDRGRSVDLFRSPFGQTNRSFAHFLQAIIIQPNLIIELVRWAAAILGQLCR